MKRKFLLLTLCFTLFFTSINFNKGYADGGIISLPILATVGSLAVGTGIVIKNNDDLYDLGKLFINYVNRNNSMTLDVLKTTFNSSVTVLNNGLVSVDSKFLDIVKGFFDDTFGSTSSDVFAYGDLAQVNHMPLTMFTSIEQIFPQTIKVSHNNNNLDLKISYRYDNSLGYILKGTFYKEDGSSYSDLSFNSRDTALITSMGFCFYPYGDGYRLWLSSFKNNEMYKSTESFKFNILDSSIVFPYSGGYTWDNVENKKENESISLPIPGNLGQLVGQDNAGFWDNTDGLVGNGDITIPNVDNPSIDLDNTISFPSTGDVPDVDVPGNDTIIPSFPSFGDSLDFSPMYLTNVTEKFPFSLPWDIGRLIEMFDVDPVAPVFDVPIVSETITLDLTEFSDLAAIVRFFVLICFVLSLIFISTRLLG